MAHTAFELDVRLREIHPPIWRTIEVPGAATLEAVHFAIQVAMGWMSSHLHQFVIGKSRYGMVGVDEDGQLEAGLLLQRSMSQLEAMMHDHDGDDLEVDDTLGLPGPLVEAVLSLAPIQRASLAALIAGSLANEILELRTAPRAHKPKRAPRR